MRLDIQYRIHFRYSEAVTESQNEVRVRPRDDDRQRLLSFLLTPRPAVAVLHAVDYWGTAVSHIGVRTTHDELELVAEASVVTAARAAPADAAPMEALASDAFRSEHFEMLAPSQHVQPSAAVVQRAEAAAAGATSVTGAVAAVVDEVRRVLDYSPGSTDIGVSLDELVAGGVGVCQDFAHLTIGMLRSVQIPARYVSGYLFAADETESADSLVEGGGPVSVQTHAWVEAAVPGSGWWALDPTNGGPVGERHVVIGCGRDYRDVSPVRGAFMGAATAEVDAEVVIGERIGPQRPATVAASAPVAAPADAGWHYQQGQQQQ